MPTKAVLALVYVLAGGLTAARAQGPELGPAAPVEDFPSVASITLTDAPVQEQADAPPLDRPTRGRRGQVSEPGSTLGDTGDRLPEDSRWLQNTACIAGPAANAMPITAPDGCQTCHRPRCGHCPVLRGILRLFTYCPEYPGACLQCCSACGYYHGAVPVYLYMRWPCRESCGCRPVQPPCQYPNTCFRRCKPAGCAFCGQHCPTP